MLTKGPIHTDTRNAILCTLTEVTREGESAKQLFLYSSTQLGPNNHMCSVTSVLPAFLADCTLLFQKFCRCLDFMPRNIYKQRKKLQLPSHIYRTADWYKHTSSC